MTLIQNQQPGNAQVREEELDEKAESENQAIAARIAMQHKKAGTKPKAGTASAEMAKMSKADLKDFTKAKSGAPKKVKEEDTDTRDTKAEKAGKRVTKDIEYDEKAKDGDHGAKRGPQDAKAEKAGKRVAKDIEHDEKVDETTTSGSVAAAPASGKKSSGGFAFGKGIYEGQLAESYAKKLTQVLNESMQISINIDSEGSKSMTVSATDEDAEQLADILKMAGISSNKTVSGCTECGAHGGMHEAACSHREQVEEELANSADNTSYANTDTMVNRLAGGLNGPKRQINPNNMGDNPLAMRELGRTAHSLNLGESSNDVSTLWNLYKQFSNK
jgi:hypothetical protein